MKAKNTLKAVEKHGTGIAGSTIEEQIAQYQAGFCTLTPETVLFYAKQLKMDKIRGVSLTSPAMTIDYLQMTLKNESTELFHVLFLDTRHRVISGETLFRGSIDGACVYPRVVAERALRLNAAAVIVSHNHPSGLPEPSLADQAITRRLKDAL